MKQKDVHICTLKKFILVEIWSRDLDTLLHKIEVITLENTLVFIHMQQ